MSATRKPKAKARSSREQDMLFDIKDTDVMLRKPDLNNLEKEVKISIYGSVGPSEDIKSNAQFQRERSSQNN